MSRILDTEALQKRLVREPKPLLVEALPRHYYDDWHLPGALHLPHDEVEARAAGLLPDRDAAIVVYCASETCRNSHVAAAALGALGYRDVSVYAGGKQAWEAAGLPVERGAAAA